MPSNKFENIFFLSPFEATRRNPKKIVHHHQSTNNIKTNKKYKSKLYVYETNIYLKKKKNFLWLFKILGSDSRYLIWFFFIEKKNQNHKKAKKIIEKWTMNKNKKHNNLIITRHWSIVWMWKWERSKALNLTALNRAATNMYGIIFLC